jgi:nucleotide-binding universal stress UspA family protein
MKRILIPTDFSANANNALEYAVETANALKAEVVILHVHNPPLTRQSALYTVISEDFSRITHDARERIHAVAEAIASEYPELNCRTEVAVGDPVDEILSLAETREVDLIVMGTKGASRVTNVLFGSNTAAVIERADCPVLCIPDGVQFKSPEKILYATDFSYSDIGAAVKLAEMAQAFKASLIFAHVVVGADESEEEVAVIRKFAEEIRKVTGYENISGLVISDASINTGLDALIEKTGVDIIALATRKRSLFDRIFNPSITKKLSYYTNIPMLAFHVEKQ